jgi:hypothetical protein
VLHATGKYEVFGVERKGGPFGSLGTAPSGFAGGLIPGDSYGSPLFPTWF